MKQALIDTDGMTVANVRIMPTDEQGRALSIEHDPYVGPVLMLADDHYCGVGMVWDGDLGAPLFEYPALLEGQTLGVWARVKSLLGIA